MPYTNSTAVATLLGGQNYDGSTDLDQYIDSADVLVSNIPQWATDKNINISDASLEIIERWLACHYYACMNQQAANQSVATGGISMSHQGQTTMRIESTRWGQRALELDFTGYLSMINRRAIATMNWLGGCAPTGVTGTFGGG